MLRTIITFVAFIGPIVGSYIAPMNNSKETIVVKYGNILSDTAYVESIYDTTALLLVFGGWVDDNPIYRVARSGVTYSMGPRATKGGMVEPWVDTLRFNRLYRGQPPSHVINPSDRVLQQSWWGDTTILSSYYSPNVTFIIRRPDVLEFVKDSNHGIFRVLRDDIQEVFIVAKYNNRLDSIRIVTVPNPYCMPWPNCYYNPWWKND